MDVLTLLRTGLGALVAVAGLVAIFGGTLGILRFPDFYTRLHGASVADAPGAALVLAGLALMAPDFAIAVRLLLLAGLVVAAGPILSHALASAAHAGGLSPLSGRYKAPRPGAQAQGDEP